MKRSTWKGQTVVYRFGVPRRHDGQVVDLDDVAMAQLRAAHDLRNELVAVVAEDFGGWGWQARIDDMTGITVRTATRMARVSGASIGRAARTRRRASAPGSRR